jgi:hypothetical protein
MHLTKRTEQMTTQQIDRYLTLTANAAKFYRDGKISKAELEMMKAEADAMLPASWRKSI